MNANNANYDNSHMVFKIPFEGKIDNNISCIQTLHVFVMEDDVSHIVFEVPFEEKSSKAPNIALSVPDTCSS